MAAGRRGGKLPVSFSDERACVQVIWRTAWLETAAGVPPPSAAAAAVPGSSLTLPSSERVWMRAEDGTGGMKLGRSTRDA